MKSPSAPALTEELARLAAEWRHPDGTAAYDLAERAVLDTVAVSLAAAHDKTVTTIFEALGADLRGGPASAWVRGASGDSRTVALVNATSAHALDFDDVDDDMIGHPSAVLVPAILAQGEEVGCSGQDVLEAYWVGLAACRALAGVIGIDSHYRAGWHSTGTIGTVAATAAGIRLRGLSVDTALHALGIAGSLASGSRQNFGTMTKPLHAGVAAANATLAVKLAAAGFTADTRQLEGSLGYLALHAAEPGARSIEEGRLGVAGLNVKLHACCYYIHAAADAMLDLVGEGLIPGDVRRIRVTGPPDGFGALIHHRPSTGLEGKFSMEYAMAACLLDGSLGLTGFTDEAVNRPEAKRLVEVVELEASTAPPEGPPEWDWTYAVVDVETADGRRLTRRVDKPRGHATRPVSEVELRRKFDDCLRYGGLDPDDQLFAALRGLRQAPSVRDVTDRLRALAVRSNEPVATVGAPSTGAGVG